MKYMNTGQKWLNCLYLNSSFSELFTSGFPTFNNLSILATITFSESKFSDLFNFINVTQYPICILKIVLCTRAVFSELFQIRSRVNARKADKF